MSKLSEKVASGIAKNSIAEVGLMADFGRKKRLWDTDLLEKVAQKEVVDQLVEQVNREREERYRSLSSTFQERLREDPEIFEETESAEVFVVFEHMARLMLLFFPDRISADVTFDKSVILQGHYGPFRFYWETFLPPNDEPLHSTLNVYNGSTLTYTGGDQAELVMKQFSQIITKLFEKHARLDLKIA